MSRGFRDSDVTLELSSQATAEALDRIHREDAAQARRAAALRAAGKRGICEDCGGGIEPERLEYLPDATRCVRCQAQWERQPKRER